MDRLRVLREQVGRAQSEAAKAENVRIQIETMRREIQKGRYYPSV
jgi:DNA-binding XRE family transcriptional regulator